MVRRVFSVMVLGLVLLLHSCEGKRFEADIDTQNYTIDLVRIDQQAFNQEVRKDVLAGWMQNLQQNHPAFSKIYFENIMRVGAASDSTTAQNYSMFVSDTLWQQVQEDINETFGDFSAQQKQLEKAIKRARYFLPFLPKPTVYTFNSGFNVAVYPDSSVLGIGLEWFLNPEHPTVNMLPPTQFPRYKRNRMLPELVVPAAMRGWLLQQLYEPYYFQQDLLREMVFYGKVLFLAQVALPEEPLHTLLNYNEDEMAWALKNQEAVWQQVVGRDLLFSTNAREVAKLTQDGPFANGFGNSSAPRLGWYLGYVMVKQYAQRSDADIQTLIKEHNEQEILKNFRPDKTPE